MCKHPCMQVWQKEGGKKITIIPGFFFGCVSTPTHTMRSGAISWRLSGIFERAWSYVQMRPCYTVCCCNWTLGDTNTLYVSCATHCNTLQRTTTHCNTRQHTATHWNTLQHTATHCNTLQLTATHCSTLQHTATHCNKLQHAATTHCNTPTTHKIHRASNS